MTVTSRAQVLAAVRRATRGQPGSRLTMEELAAGAGVSRATLYRMFADREALLAELGLEAPPSVRNRILDTALELVGRTGIAALSMDNLAAAAGVSRATLYRMFPGKAALSSELIRWFSPFEPIVAVLETGADRPPAEIIPVLARAMATSMNGHMGLILQLLFEISQGDPSDSNGPSDPSHRSDLRDLGDQGGSHTSGTSDQGAKNEESDKSYQGGKTSEVRQGGRGEDRQGSQSGAVLAGRSLPLLAGYLARQMAAGRLRTMDPALAVQALAGPIVMHLLSRPLAMSRPGLASGSGSGGNLEDVASELAEIWLRGMHPGEPDGAPRRARESGGSGDIARVGDDARKPRRARQSRRSDDIARASEDARKAHPRRA